MNPTKVHGPGPTTSTIGICMGRGTGPKTVTVKGTPTDRVLVEGWGVKISIPYPRFHLTERIPGVNNGVGLHQKWGKGQNFRGEWRINGTGISMEAVNHTDTNDHVFVCNGTALASIMWRSRTRLPA